MQAEPQFTIIPAAKVAAGALFLLPEDGAWALRIEADDPSGLHHLPLTGIHRFNLQPTTDKPVYCVTIEPVLRVDVGSIVRGDQIKPGMICIHAGEYASACDESSLPKRVLAVTPKGKTVDVGGPAQFAFAHWQVGIPSALEPLWLVNV